MCEKMVNLMHSQKIKNYKFLILNLIQHVFTQVTFNELFPICTCSIYCNVIEVIPVPKPRGIDLNDSDLYTSGRKERRHILQKEAKSKSKKVGLKSISKSQLVFEKSKVDASTSSSESPDFAVGNFHEKEVIAQPCIWDDDISYELQVCFTQGWSKMK